MSIFNMPIPSAYGQNVKPSRGAQLYFFEAGTTTPKASYTTADESVAHPVPVVANANGRFPAIYISGTFKARLTDLDDVQIWEEDNLSNISGTITPIGDFDSSTNAGDYPSGGSSGDQYRVTERFTLNSASGGHTVQVGDFIQANKDGASAIDADWDISRGKVPNYNTVALADGANIATDCSKGSIFTVTLGADRTLDNPTNKIIGQVYTWIVTGAGFGLTYGTDFDFVGSSDVFKNGITVIEGTVVSSSSIRCKILNGPEKLINFESTNLVIELLSTTQVKVTADAMRLINSDGIAVTRYNVEETFDISTDIHSGTEKASHWYTLNISCDNETDAFTLKMAPILTGTTDSTTTDKLNDSGATFTTDIGSFTEFYQPTARNRTDNNETKVTAVDSNIVLSVADDFFASGEDYEIFIPKPVFASTG